MSRYIVKPIVCDYGVYGDELVCICNCQENAELIADILNADKENDMSYSYSVYPFAKFHLEKGANI